MKTKVCEECRKIIETDWYYAALHKECVNAWFEEIGYKKTTNSISAGLRKPPELAPSENNG